MVCAWPVLHMALTGVKVPKLCVTDLPMFRLRTSSHSLVHFTSNTIHGFGGTLAMSLYHETASVLNTDTAAGGNLRSRVFTRKELKSPPTQVYALALETCKWSPILSEIITNSQLLQHEKKVSANDVLQCIKTNPLS